MINIISLFLSVFGVVVKGAGENIQWILHKNEHNLADALLRNGNSIVGEVGETLTQLITRLGWI